ncbi:hypothetical protein ACSBR2_013282 [Camellia fascicularis]
MTLRCLYTLLWVESCDPKMNTIFTELKACLRNFLALIMAYKITNSVDIRSKGVPRISNSSIGAIGSSSRTPPSSELLKQGKQDSLLHGVPDFAEVYTFIGSVFDPDTKGHI